MKQKHNYKILGSIQYLQSQCYKLWWLISPNSYKYIRKKGGDEVCVYEITKSSLTFSANFILKLRHEYIHILHCCSVNESCPTLCDPVDYSTPGFPALHHFPEIAQAHVPWVGDAIQSSRPLLSLLLLPSIFPSIRFFSIELALCIT